MLTRRNLLALSAAVPFSHLPRRLDLPDLRVENLRLEDGVRILGISPDGSTLVGTVDDDEVCFLDTDSLEEIARGELPGIVTKRDWMTLRWSQDSSQIVFGTLNDTSDRATAIYTVDKKTARVTELPVTTSGDQATPVGDSADFTLDLYPEWLDDQTIVFARQVFGRNGDTVAFMRMGLNDDEPAIWNDLQGLDITMITGPTRMLSDGRLVFVANPVDSSYLANPKDNAYRLFTLAAGEEPVQVETGDLQKFMVIDADETHVLLHDVQMYATVRLAWDDPSAQEDVRTLFTGELDRAINSIPAIGPEPGTLVVTMNDANRTVLVYKDNLIREIAYLRGPETAGLDCHWVNDRVLVTGNDASWVIETDL